MNLRNCPECGKVFTYIRTNLCPACQAKDEEDFRAVRKFIAENPGADILSVSESTGISETRIFRYLREGRIHTAGRQGGIKLECEVCGELISSGRYCKNCADKLSAGLKKSIMEENQKALEEMKQKGPRMYTADHWEKRK